MSDKSTDRLIPAGGDPVMNDVLAKIMGPTGAVWRWFPQKARVDDLGLPKYTSFTEYVCRQGGQAGHAVTYGDFHGDIKTRLAILQVKVDVVSTEVPTSLLARNLKRDPPIYAGGSLEPGMDESFWVRAGSGLPELVDHLVICRNQLSRGLIKAWNYGTRTGLNYNGISDLLAESDMHTSAYLSMQKDIEGYFDEALKTVLD